MAISVWKLMRFSSAVSSSWHCSSGPRTRSSGSCGKTTVPSGMASTSHESLQLAQVVEKRRLEQRFSVGAGERRQIRQIVAAELEAVEVVERRGQSAGHAEAAFERLLAKDQVKHGLAIRAARLPIAVGHGQLVQVREQGERLAVLRKR